MHHIAGLDAVKGTLLGLRYALFDGIEERATHSTARHTNRALNDLDIALRGVEICLLEANIGIALLGGNEACTHLHARST